MSALPWFDLLQTFALIATLLLVVRQLRQVDAGARRDAANRAAEDIDRFNELLLVHPGLNRFVYAHLPGFADRPLEEQEYWTYLTLVLGRFERLFLLQQKGMLDPNLWESWRSWVADTWFTTELAREIWEAEGRFYSTKLQTFINATVSARGSAAIAKRSPAPRAPP